METQSKAYLEVSTIAKSSKNFVSHSELVVVRPNQNELVSNQRLILYTVLVYCLALSFERKLWWRGHWIAFVIDEKQMCPVITFPFDADSVRFRQVEDHKTFRVKKREARH